MGNIKEQKLRKIKRSNIAGSIVGLLVLGAIIFAAFAFMLMTFVMYITDSKVREQYERASEVAENYKAKGSAEGDWIIVDGSGKIIKENGTNTCDLAGGGRMENIIVFSEAAADAEIEDSKDLPELHERHADFAQSVIDNAITVYPDTRHHIIKAGPKGSMWIDFSGFRRSFNELIEEAKKEGDDEVSYIRLPFWTQVPLGDGTNMICKSSFDMNFREITILGILAVIIFVLTIALLIFMICFLCKSFRNRKRMTEVLFMDEITGKHNWMWFLTNADRLLRRKSNASNKYAVLEVVFVNYRNFCVCHSVKEGEEMLCLVGDKIE